MTPHGTLTIPHYGAFESTKIHGAGTDIIATTRHVERWRHDLELLASAGIMDLRYSIPWHRIEAKPGVFDFTWVDGPLRYMKEHGMRPVVDLLHHTSFPDWLEQGFLNPEFPRLYARFVQHFLDRYEWVDRFTVFNEPLATALMCTVIGAWYPHQTSDAAFARMAVNVGRAICLSEALVKRANPRACSVYIDTCESHQSLDRKADSWVHFTNHRRFCLLDLVLGKIEENQVMFSYYLKHGVKADELQWFKDHSITPDILGLDYYPHSEIDWSQRLDSEQADIAFPVSSPRGFASVAMDYVERYRLPILLTETNIRGTIFDRITWLRFMEEQSFMLLRRGVDLRGFCWYPSIDSTDWGNLCTKSTLAIDPQGIWYLSEPDQRWTRFRSELSDWYERLARGTASFSDLPAYRFEAPLDGDLSGYVKLMEHWDTWVFVPGTRKAA